MIPVLKRLSLSRNKDVCNCFFCGTAKVDSKIPPKVSLPVTTPNIGATAINFDLQAESDHDMLFDEPSGASSLKAMYGQSPNKASNSALNASLSQCDRSEFVEFAMENFSPKRRGMLLVATVEEAQDMKKTKSPPRFSQALGGPKQPVLLGKKAIEKVIKENQPQVPLKMFHDWACDRNSSNNGVLVLAKQMRQKMGRKFIQTGLQDSLVDRTKEMAQFFGPKEMEMEVRPGVGQDYVMKKKVCVSCKDVPGFLAYVMEARGKGITTVLMGADGGQGSFKVCCNCVEELPPEKYIGPKEASSSRSTGYLDSGVKRTFILFKAKGVPETYHNLKCILEALKLTEIDSINTMPAPPAPKQHSTYDLKLEMIAAGMPNMSSGKYCCHICFTHKVYDGRSKYTWVANAKLRTLGDQRKYAASFNDHFEAIKRKYPLKSESECFKIAKKKAMDHFNVIHFPLLSGLDSTLMLLLLPPCEFHIFEGNVNRIADALNEIWSEVSGVEDKLYVWLEGDESGLYIKRNDHRKAMDGPECKKVLDNLGKLERDLPFNLNASLSVYLTAFRAFNDVRHSCFSNQLIGDYGGYIKYFHSVCLRLRNSQGEPINLINKMHILFEHVEMYCSLTQKGLGFVSEQAKEACHFDYLGIEKNFQCAEGNPHFGDMETKGVIRYNTDHLGAIEKVKSAKNRRS